jgi:hypothetical protein
MVAACGLPTALRAQQAFTLPTHKSGRMNDTRSTVFVADNDDLVPAAIQGMPKSVGRYENSHTKV